MNRWFFFDHFVNVDFASVVKEFFLFVIIHHVFVEHDLLLGVDLEILELQLLLDNHWVFDNRVFEVILLDLFVVVAFDGVTENASAVLPPPELAALVHHVFADLHHMVTGFSPVGVEVDSGVLIFGRNEEQRSLFRSGVGNEVLELNNASQHHFDQSIVDSTFPVVVILFHVRRSSGVLHFNEAFDAFQELFIDLSILFHQFTESPFELFLEVVVEVN